MPHFPARRFAWSALEPWPAVGPLLGVDQVPPGHGELLERLAERHEVDDFFAVAISTGWLELRDGVYTLNHEADGVTGPHLTDKEHGAMCRALERWASNEGARFVYSSLGI